MAHFLYNSVIDDDARGNIDWDNDTFRVMLTTESYFPNKATHSKRSHVTPYEVANSGTYSSGGNVTTVTVTTGTTTVTIAFSSMAYTGFTGNVRYAVVYKSRGGADTADELVLLLDFGSMLTVTNGSVTVTFNSPITISNPD